MKIKLSTNSGVFDRNVIMDGFVATDYFTLSRNPLTGTEAATKQYVDNFPYSLSVSNISDGIIPIEMIGHSFKGDLRSTTPAYNALAPIGDAGSYTRYNVNAKGQIVSGIPATQDVITPSLSFNEISGVPKTAGQLITNLGPYVLPAAGASATLSNNLTLSREPTNNTEAATYRYGLNKMVAAGSAHKVGDIAIKPSTLTNATYLRANGAWLNRTTYATLYAAIGLQYSFGAGTVQSANAGQPWCQQGLFNTSTNGTSPSVTSSGSLPAASVFAATFATKNRVYRVGGWVSGIDEYTVVTRNIYTAPINANGTLGSWSLVGQYPKAVFALTAVMTKNYVYLMGGQPYESAYAYQIPVISDVYMAPINSDGTIGALVKTTSLPFAGSQIHATVIKNYVYIFGGYTGLGVTNNIYRAIINSDGTLGGWVYVGTLPTGGYYSNFSTVWANTGKYIYAYLPNSYAYAPINNDGSLGSWVTYTLPRSGSTPYFDTSGYASTVVTKNRVFVFGGGGIKVTNRPIQNGGPLYSAFHSYYFKTVPINSDGTLGAWSQASILPGGICGSSPVITNSRLYLIGGTTITTPSSGYYLSLFSAHSATAAIYATPFNGGTNDYVTLIAEGGIDPTLFKLPDLSSKKDGIYEYYIKATY